MAQLNNTASRDKRKDALVEIIREKIKDDSSLRLFETHRGVVSKSFKGFVIGKKILIFPFHSESIEINGVDNPNGFKPNRMIVNDNSYLLLAQDIAKKYEERFPDANFLIEHYSP
ncbi:MAG TPA: hypothetical protein ENG87_03740 [Candidatus Pacearchaeota archaeon]|nr:hypothetical protein BMS3Abin17_01164 [archaeon BMS3Abin17]HDK42465.1 hypothetical protein [Candidatus Pacearchaeota archaeon]HDZ60958.1 hypothetical protein [Candidatus Pacearchaeota archaeon]